MDYEKIAEGVEVGGGAAATSSPRPAAPIDPATLAVHQVREFYPVDHPKYQGLAEAKGYDQSHARIQATRYTHEAMIDVILANPAIKQNELAKTFDRSVPWISRIIGSDAFQAALAKRREELTDPFLVATIEERMRGLAYQSLDIITEKLESAKNVDLALKSLDIAAKSLGFGARGGGGSNTNQFIIQLPPKSENSTAWAIEHGPMKQAGSDG
jgi:hypothetical protein